MKIDTRCSGRASVGRAAIRLLRRISSDRGTEIDAAGRADVVSAFVADYFLVERSKGTAWDHSRLRREQDGWAEHAAFMDALSEQGFVVLLGPIGEADAIALAR